VPRTGLFLFSNDLRLHDNPALHEASRSVDRLLCAYCLDPARLRPGRLGLADLGEHRYRFLLEGLRDLNAALVERGQHLLLLHRPAHEAVPDLCERFAIDLVFCNEPADYRAHLDWQRLHGACPRPRYLSLNGSTLFRRDQLPFTLAALPATFSAFRRRVEKLAPGLPELDAPALPPAPLMPAELLQAGLPAPVELASPFRGGVSAARTAVEDYFARGEPSRYKTVRNELDGWYNSSKWSPWLAQGALSPGELYRRLQSYEREIEANESTYWLYFELLWREYFQWYARAHGERLYAFNGTGERRPLTSFYPERFRRWCAGETPFPIVNACMRQLNATGYMSNRGRQLVVSCFVNELALDWRYGAAYFQQQLLDYDPATNWGNWQYLAGVGADPRGQRRFDLHKQARRYDPQGEFVRSWQAQRAPAHLDSVDAADWPVAPPGTP
jgi:deoxyribodipyrimidine photo-lyase